MFAGIGQHLGPIHTDGSHRFQMLHPLRYQKHLQKAFLEEFAVHPAKHTDRVVLGMMLASADVAHGHIVMGRRFNLPGTESPRRITVNQ